jgi:general secretion pathway protein G
MTFLDKARHSERRPEAGVEESRRRSHHRNRSNLSPTDSGSHPPNPYPLNPNPCSSQSGLTLVELIIVIAILGLLSTMALPIARFEVKRQKERQLRIDLWEMRRAIDAYKDAADKGGIQTKTDSFNYPPDLDTLVQGVEIQSKQVRFLRKIPEDPFTHSTDWNLISMQDDVDATSWGGQNVFNVHSKSTGTALDGTKYDTW